MSVCQMICPRNVIVVWSKILSCGQGILYLVLFTISADRLSPLSTQEKQELQVNDIPSPSPQVTHPFTVTKHYQHHI